MTLHNQPVKAACNSYGAKKMKKTTKRNRRSWRRSKRADHGSGDTGSTAASFGGYTQAPSKSEIIPIGEMMSQLGPGNSPNSLTQMSVHMAAYLGKVAAISSVKRAFSEAPSFEAPGGGTPAVPPQMNLNDSFSRFMADKTPQGPRQAGGWVAPRPGGDALDRTLGGLPPRNVEEMAYPYDLQRLQRDYIARQNQPPIRQRFLPELSGGGGEIPDEANYGPPIMSGAEGQSMPPVSLGPDQPEPEPDSLSLPITPKPVEPPAPETPEPWGGVPPWLNSTAGRGGAGAGIGGLLGALAGGGRGAVTGGLGGLGAGLGSAAARHFGQGAGGQVGGGLAGGALGLGAGHLLSKLLPRRRDEEEEKRGESWNGKMKDDSRITHLPPGDSPEWVQNLFGGQPKFGKKAAGFFGGYGDATGASMEHMSPEAQAKLRAINDFLVRNRHTLRATVGTGVNAAMGAGLGAGAGTIAGALRGNTPEGMGRGLLRGGITGAGAGLGGAGAGALADYMGGGRGAQGIAGILGMLGGGAAGWAGSGKLLGKPQAGREEKKGAARLRTWLSAKVARDAHEWAKRRGSTRRPSIPVTSTAYSVPKAPKPKGQPPSGSKQAGAVKPNQPGQKREFSHLAPKLNRSRGRATIAPSFVAPKSRLKPTPKPKGVSGHFAASNNSLA